MVKDKCSKKKRLATMIQKQSASRVQLPSLSSSKDRKHGKRRHASCRRTKQIKTRARAESDNSSGQDSEQTGEGDSSGGEGSASSGTDDGSSEDVIAMNPRTKHVHKKRRSKLKRNDNGSKTFPTSCCTVASGRGSLKRVQHLRTLQVINKARLLLCAVHRASRPPRRQVAVRPHRGPNPRTRLADFHMADKNEFRLTMRNFYFARGKGLRSGQLKGCCPRTRNLLRSGGVVRLARRVAPIRGAVSEADGDAGDDDKLRQNAV